MTLNSDIENILNPLLASFDKKITADISGQLAEIYVSGSTEMITWGKTKGGIPIAYEGPPISQAVDWAEKYSSTLVKGIDEETKRRLAHTISQGIENKRGIPGLSRDIRKSFDGMSKFRSQTIARTETANALSQASLDRMNDMGIDGKEWVWGGEECDICEENENAGVIGVKDTFPSGHDRPPAHPNCICVVAPARLPEKLPEEPKVPPKKGLSGNDWAKSLSRDERRVVNYWQGSGYENIRVAQQTGKASSSIKGAIKDLNAALNRAQSYDGTVFRGLNNLNPKTFNIIRKSKTLRWDALSSSAKTEKAAARFLHSAGNNQSIMFKITNKTGIDLTPIVGKQEAEVLLRQGAKYRVVSTSEKTYATVGGRTKKALEMVLEEI